MGIGILKGLNTKKEHILSDYINHGAVFNDLKSSCFYESGFEQIGTLTITKIDTVSHVIAGTFEFTVWTEECDTINVTDGRFDIDYYS